MRVVHQEERDPVVRRRVADADELPVAAEVGECQRGRSSSLRPAMLPQPPVSDGGGCKLSRCDERGLALGQHGSPARSSRRRFCTGAIAHCGLLPGEAISAAWLVRSPRRQADGATAASPALVARIINLRARCRFFEHD
jgi:hypothetical protein